MSRSSSARFRSGARAEGLATSQIAARARATGPGRRGCLVRYRRRAVAHVPTGGADLASACPTISAPGVQTLRNADVAIHCHVRHAHPSHHLAETTSAPAMSRGAAFLTAPRTAERRGVEIALRLGAPAGGHVNHRHRRPVPAYPPRLSPPHPRPRRPLQPIRRRRRGRSTHSHDIALAARCTRMPPSAAAD